MIWRELSENRRSQLLLAGATILALLPFLNRAFDIDEPLFLWMAQQIARSPFDPYGFEANWAGFAQPMWLPMQNPPLCSYYIAAVAAVIGWSEPALHAAFLVPAIGAILGTFALARRLCDRPVNAALLTLLTPVFLVSAGSVMCDVMLLAFWVWSIELWLAGLERGQHWLFASSALLAAAAILTKYFGLALVPLLLVHTLVQTRRCRPSLAYLCIPLLALLSYELLTYARYGMPLFTGAMLYLHQVAEAGKAPLAINSLTGCSFLGGSILTVFFVVPWKWRWALGALALWLAMAILFAVFVAGSGAFGNNTTAMQMEGGLFVAAGFATLALAFYHFGQRNDAPSLMLLLWIAGTFLFSAFLNWSITAPRFCRSSRPSRFFSCATFRTVRSRLLGGSIHGASSARARCRSQLRGPITGKPALLAKPRGISAQRSPANQQRSGSKATGDFNGTCRNGKRSPSPAQPIFALAIS